MTREEAIRQLREQQTGDIEIDHVDADRILCEFLRELGYADVVEEWEKVEKWYA